MAPGLIGFGLFDGPSLFGNVGLNPGQQIGIRR